MPELTDSAAATFGGVAGLIIGAVLLQLYYWLRRHWGD